MSTVTVEPHPALTLQEKEELAKAETAIEEARKCIARAGRSFVVSGTELRRIRDSRLWRESHVTFTEYCKERWGWKDHYVSLLIGASQVMQVLKVDNCQYLPSNESQARPLLKLSRQEKGKDGRLRVLDAPAIVQAWKEVIEDAPKGKKGEPLIHSKRVAEIVASHTETPARSKEIRENNDKHREKKLCLRKLYKPIDVYDCDNIRPMIEGLVALTKRHHDLWSVGDVRSGICNLLSVFLKACSFKQEIENVSSDRNNHRRSNSGPRAAVRCAQSSPGGAKTEGATGAVVD